MVVEDKIRNKDNTEKEIDSSNIDEIFADFLKQNKAEPENIEKEILEQDKKKPDEIIKNANNWFLVKILAPQISKNEAKKRKHKDWLMIIMSVFLALQFSIVAVMIGYSGYHIINVHKAGTPFSDSTLKIIFTFIGGYITSVVVELIAILKYIVKNVFDTSVSGMVNHFKENKE